MSASPGLPQTTPFLVPPPSPAGPHDHKGTQEGKVSLTQTDRIPMKGAPGLDLHPSLPLRTGASPATIPALDKENCQVCTRD